MLRQVETGLGCQHQQCTFHRITYDRDRILPGIQTRVIAQQGRLRQIGE